VSGAKRAKHIYFDIEYWRGLEKTFADSAARYASDDGSRSAIIARCRIGILRYLERDAEFGTAKKLPVKQLSGAPARDMADSLYVWLEVEKAKALSTSKGSSLDLILAPLFRKGDWRVVTDLVAGNHLDIKSIHIAKRLHRQGGKMLDANPALARTWASHLGWAIASRKRATDRRKAQILSPK
jgi:hypothetical protein